MIILEKQQSHEARGTETLVRHSALVWVVQGQPICIHAIRGGRLQQSGDEDNNERGVVEVPTSLSLLESSCLLESFSENDCVLYTTCGREKDSAKERY